jgi:FMN phosphatase YigB (HAD superfamily)
VQLGIFDFVIRAEDVGVSKPDKRVYKADVAALMLRLGQDKRIIEEFFLGESFDDGIATDSTYMASETEITASTPHIGN